MGCCSSTPNSVATSAPPGKMLAQPKFKGTERVPLFNGLLYRLIDSSTGEWAFFANTRDYEFHVKYLFGPDSQIEPLDNTKLEVQDDGFICETVVYPLETKMFVKGNVDGFESKVEALPLSEEYFGSHPELDEAAYYRRLDAPKSTQF